MDDEAQRIEDAWRGRLLGTDPSVKARRGFHAKLPSSPRCELCAWPFGAPVGPLFRIFGRHRFSRNPRYCSGCLGYLIRGAGGAEVPVSFLFADVRGSTPLGESLGPRALHEVMDRFYRTGVEALIAYGALIDRFMGDQVVGYFVPGFAGPEHARQAVLCGLEILRATGHDDGMPWIPVGAGVHTGEAFVGSVGKGEDLAELTAIGDAVNIGARLASVADIGELVVSEAAYAAAGLDREAESRELVLKGVTAPVSVRVLRAGKTAAIV